MLSRFCYCVRLRHQHNSVWLFHLFKELAEKRENVQSQAAGAAFSTPSGSGVGTGATGYLQNDHVSNTSQTNSNCEKR